MAYDPWWEGVYQGAHGDENDRRGQQRPRGQLQRTNQKEEEWLNAFEQGELRPGVPRRLRDESVAALVSQDNGLDTLRTLLARGMDPHIGVGEGTPLPVALLVSLMYLYDDGVIDEDEIRAWLGVVAADGSLAVADPSGRTVLHVLFGGEGEGEGRRVYDAEGRALVRWMVQAGADPDLPDQEGVTPAMVVMRRAETEAEAMDMLRVLNGSDGSDVDLDRENAAGESVRSIAEGRGWRLGWIGLGLRLGLGQRLGLGRRLQTRKGKGKGQRQQRKTRKTKTKTKTQKTQKTKTQKTQTLNRSYRQKK